MLQGKGKTSSLGFTFIELLVAVSLVVVLAVVTVANYRNFSNQRTVKNVAEELKGYLVLAQKSAQAGKKLCTGTYLGTRVVIAADGCILYSVCDDGGENLVDFKSCQFSDPDVNFSGFGDGSLDFDTYGVPQEMMAVNIEKGDLTWQILIDTSGTFSLSQLE